MKAKIVLAIIMLSGMMCLSACSEQKNKEEANKQTEENESKEEDRMEAYRTPTEAEMKILEDCNLSENYMKEIKEKGMSVSVQSFVDTARIMLDYLEEKYGEEFVAAGGEIPGVISGDYMIFAKAADGEYAGKKFEVYYRADEEGNGYCEDGYFAILKNNEFQQMMQERADETGDGWKVFTKLSGTYGKEYGKDTDISKVSPEAIYADTNCIMTPEKTEEEYENELEKLRQKFNGYEYNMRVYYCQFLNLEKWEQISDYNASNEIMKEQTEENQVYRGALFD